jgi:hypothetical protein
MSTYSVGIPLYVAEGSLLASIENMMEEIVQEDST